MENRDETAFNRVMKEIIRRCRKERVAHSLYSRQAAKNCQSLDGCNAIHPGSGNDCRIHQGRNHEIQNFRRNFIYLHVCILLKSCSLSSKVWSLGVKGMKKEIEDRLTYVSYALGKRQVEIRKTMTCLSK